MNRLVYLLLMIVLFSSGCRTIKPDIIYKDKLLYVNHFKHDSIYNYVHDSISIKQKGDTVFYNNYHTNIKYKDRIVNDTVIDKQYYNITKTVEVNRLNILQKILISVGVLSIISFALWLFIKLK